MSRRRSGFTLVEVLAAMLIFVLVLLLLFRGFSALSGAMIQGQRRSQTSRALAVTREAMREDLRQALVSPRWPLLITPGSGEPALALLRHRHEADAAHDSEWVQYWREESPATTNVFRWVRYAGPATQRAGVTQEWWTVVTTNDLTGEILLDAALEVEIFGVDADGELYADAIYDEPPEAVDFLLAAAPEPVPPLRLTSTNLLPRARALDASWLRARVRPRLGRGPLPEGVP